jgi:hypothetical protein
MLLTILAIRASPGLAVEVPSRGEARYDQTLVGTDPCPGQEGGILRPGRGLDV